MRQLQKEYAAVTPEARRIVERETRFYDERYGNIIAELKAYEKKRDVLFTVKWAMALAIIALAAWIFGAPRLRRHATSYLFIGLPVLLSLVFVAVPAAVALYLSMTQYHSVLPLWSTRWVGGENYAEVARSGDLVKSLGRTAVYVIFTLPAGIAISLVLAAMLNTKLRGERFLRFVFFSPMVTSVVSISLIFSQLFLGSKQGWLNAFLSYLGLTRDPILFLHNEWTFLYCVMVLAVWSGLAFNILIFLAGL